MGMTEKAFLEHEVSPNLIPISPKNLATVTYSNGAIVIPGEELTPTQVKDIPTVLWEYDKDTLYTLIMIDPDATSRLTPTLREVRHWLVGNIPENRIEQGDTLVEYIGAGAPEGTGLHRYIFLVYKQSEKTQTDGTFTSNRSSDGRLNTSTKDYATVNKLGDPVAGNFFQAKYDDYVPVLHKQLGNQ